MVDSTLQNDYSIVKMAIGDIILNETLIFCDGMIHQMIRRDRVNDFYEVDSINIFYNKSDYSVYGGYKLDHEFDVVLGTVTNRYYKAIEYKRIEDVKECLLFLEITVEDNGSERIIKQYDFQDDDERDRYYNSLYNCDSLNKHCSKIRKLIDIAGECLVLVRKCGGIEIAVDCEPFDGKSYKKIANN